MGIEKVLSSALQSMSIATKKNMKKLKVPVKSITKGAKKLEFSLDCLASGKKVLVNKIDSAAVGKIKSQEPDKFVDILTKKVDYFEPKSVKNFAKESVRSGLNAKEAINGAKELMHAITKPTGFSAKESAKTFIEAGPSQLERKLDLNEKYGKKLGEKKLAQALENGERIRQEKIAKELIKVDELLK